MYIAYQEVKKHQAFISFCNNHCYNRTTTMNITFVLSCATITYTMYKRQRYNIILKQCEILCKEINKRLWLILSNRNGTKLNHKAAYKYLLKRGLIKLRENKDQHLLSIEEIEILCIYVRGHVANNMLLVSKSLIEQAGNGLFAAKKIEKGQLLCIYRGTKLSFAQVLKLPMSEKDYIMGGFGLNVHVDASKHLNILARYINDNFDKTKINVEFKKLEKDACALVYSLRCIEPGEELYAGYGESYWRGRDMLK